MIRGKPLLAVIPVRAGSKGIPGKNLKRLGKDTLLERAIKIAQRCHRVDRIQVSTDDVQMYELAQTYKAAAPGLRPLHLASDSARTADVVVDLASQIGFDRGYILLLQATSPLRTLDDLSAFLDLFETHTDDEAAVSVCALRGAHPEKLLTVSGGKVSAYGKSGSDRPRQEMAELFEPNGAFYIIDIETLRQSQTFLPPKTLAYAMPEARSANLDTLTDWQVLEAMIAQGHWSVEEYD